MTILDKIKTEIVKAMKAKDTARLTTLRMVSAEITKESQKKGQVGPLTSDQELAVLSREIKSRQDEIEVYASVGNDTKVLDLNAEIAIIDEFRPKQASDDEIIDVIRTTMADTGIDKAGPLTGKVMGQLKGKADGRRVKALIEKVLA